MRVRALIGCKHEHHLQELHRLSHIRAHSARPRAHLAAVVRQATLEPEQRHHAAQTARAITHAIARDHTHAYPSCSRNTALMGMPAYSSSSPRSSLCDCASRRMRTLTEINQQQQHTHTHTPTHLIVDMNEVGLRIRPSFCAQPKSMGTCARTVMARM
jgi:hypothetical protein